MHNIELIYFLIWNNVVVNMKKNIITQLLSLSLFYSYSSYAQDVQFNEQALSILGISDIDLNSFEKSEQSDGSYFVGVSVNGRKIDFFDKIMFAKKDDKTQACLPETLIKVIGLKEEFIKKIPLWNQDECFDLGAQDEHIKVNFDDEKQELLLSIPQVYFLYNDDNWVPPQQRDNGVNALIFDYSIIDSYLNGRNSASQNTLSSYGTVGANVGSWRLRNNYQYQNNFNSTNKRNDLQWVQTYAFTDLPDLASKLFVGKHYTSSNIFDSVRFKGVSAFSDENMLPALLRGYAPNVTGTATSNATVTISQNGRMLSQVKVPPGPFSIDNLSSSLSGTLDVNVTEENGSVRQFQVVTTSAPFLTRPGSVRYKVNAGKLDPLDYRDVDTGFLSSELSFGLLNNLSAYAGLFSTTSSEYQSYSLGLGANMAKWGALSFDVTQSLSDIVGLDKQQGESYRMSYAKRFSNSSRLNLTGYQFSNEGYMSVNNYIAAKSLLSNTPYRQKNLFSTSFSQQLLDWNAEVGLNYSRETYWNSTQSNDNLSLSFNKTLDNAWLKDTVLTVSVSQNTSSEGGNFKQAYASLSIPFGGNSNSRIQYFGSYDGQSKNQNNNINYYTRRGDNSINLGVSNTNLYDNASMNASVSRDTPYSNMQVSGSYGQHSHSLSGALDGSLTVTKQGPVFHRKVYQNQARMIIDADKAKNVSVNENESITNHFGLAGISNVPTYYRSTQYLDLNNMPENVSIEDNVIQSALTAGAVGYAKVNAVIGEKALLTIMLADGTTPPFGAIVYDKENNKQLGIIAERGQTYLTGIRNKQVMSINWNGNQSCQIAINTSDIQTLKQLTCSKEST